MKLRRQYTAAEVGKFLKDSEQEGVASGPGAGHAEGLHELQAAGRDRPNTTVQGLIDRAVGEMKEMVGAFDGCQIAAVTFALNSAAGQNALGHLEPAGVDFIFAVIDVQNQHFRMKEAKADVYKAPMYGTPLGAYSLGVQNRMVQGVAMKLMKDDKRQQLHIRTAYPMSALPGNNPSHCVITYNTNAQPQNLPI